MSGIDGMVDGMKDNDLIRRYNVRPIDFITSVYLASSGILALAWWERLDGDRFLIPVYLVGAGLALTVPPLLRKMNRPATRFLSAWYPVFALTLCYHSTAFLNKASPIPVLDDWLHGIDIQLFGDTVCKVFTASAPALIFAEIMAFAYFSYYFMLPGLALILWIRNRPLFYDFMFCTSFCFYSFYLFFSLFPSHGPRYFVYGGTQLWEGIVFGPILTDLLNAMEVPTGAFPSSHVGIALIVLVFAWRHNRLTGWITTILSVLLSASILYGGPHYFIDLPCGIMVGTAFLLLAGPVAGKLEGFLGKKNESGITCPSPFTEKK